MRYLVLIVGILLALWRSEPPTAKPANTAPETFSATRAFADIKVIAAKPHPVGSAEHERVKAYLVSRLAAMGLNPVVQSKRQTQEDVGRTISAPVSNVVGVLKGVDSTKPAILVMSHYDTVPDSPGAADDTSGVATSLEIARAVKAGPKPPRDIVFLFTDGEELGLMGAGAFFQDSPLLRHIGAVVNFDVRGDSGLAVMYETGPGNAETVALWRAKAERISSNSLASAIYKRMPNGTDFTLATERRLPGLNFAFLGDEAAYHSALATPEHLNLGSVQHLGDQGLAAVRAFAKRIPEQKSDAIYSDVFGFFMIQYDASVGWILFAATVLLVLYAIVRAQGVTSFAWGRGLGSALAAVFLPVAGLYLLGLWFGSTHHFLRLAHFDFLLAGAGLFAIGAALFGATLFHGKRPEAVWQWLMLLLLALATLMQMYLPEGAFVVVWPLLTAALIGVIRFAFYRGEPGVLPTIIAVLASLAVVVQVAMMAIVSFTSLGVTIPLVLVLPILTALPVLLLLPGKPLPRSVHLVVALVGVMLFAYGRYAEPTAARPAPSLIRYVADLDHGKAYRIDYLKAGDGWTRSALGEARFAALPFTQGISFWWAPAKMAAVPKPDLTIRREGNTLIVLAKPQPGSWLTTLSVRAKNGLGASHLEGTTVAASGPGDWHDMRYFVPGPDGFTWIVPTPKSGSLEMRLVALYPSWPKDAAKLSPLPANRMRFNNTETTEVVLQRVWKP